MLAIVPYFVTIALNTYGVTEEEVVQEELQAVEAGEIGIPLFLSFFDSHSITSR